MRGSPACFPAAPGIARIAAPAPGAEGGAAAAAAAAAAAYLPAQGAARTGGPGPRDGY